MKRARNNGRAPSHRGLAPDREPLRVLWGSGLCGRLIRVEVNPLDDAQTDGKPGKQKLDGVLAHQVGAVCPRGRANRRNADQHDEDQAGFQNSRICLTVRHVTHPIKDMVGANDGYRELESCKKGRKLDQPDRPETEQTTDGKNVLGTPNVIQAIARRRENTQRIVAPNQGKIERNGDNRGHSGR